jgi:hypothetical protein
MDPDIVPSSFTILYLAGVPTHETEKARELAAFTMLGSKKKDAQCPITAYVAAKPTKN